jgi:hypothetical protein
MKAITRGIILVIPLAIALPFALGQFSLITTGGTSGYFTPAHRLSGIGVDREQISDELLARRTELMMESQTFSIMRDPQSLAGAKRITSPKLQQIFKAASERSGIPASLISAVAYLESWGDPKAESPAGPKGIMQISEATARRMGLKIVRSKRYRVTTERRKVRTKKGTSYRTVKVRTPYMVTVADERLIPERAIPAAANYLRDMESHFGGRDWAVFAYHCGEGCVSDFLSLVQRARDLKEAPTVARVFFSANPVRNREIYQAIRHHMDRDYSPTYWFRVMRAEQLLDLYSKDPDEFAKLIDQYRYEVNPTQRAPHRLSVWLRADDIAYKTCDDIRKDEGKRLVQAFDNPNLFGFTLRRSGAGAIGEEDPDPVNREYYLQASPAALGTLAYIAFETHRLHSAMHPKGESFVPLEVTGLVRTLAYQDMVAKRTGQKSEHSAHCTGQVFDIDVSRLPPGQREALQFILDDMGWDGYLGFVEEAPNSGVLHIGCAPSARDFFAEIFQEALAQKL